jgi:hypothetical protein
VFDALDDQHMVRLFQQALEHVQESGRGPGAGRGVP